MIRSWLVLIVIGCGGSSPPPATPTPPPVSPPVANPTPAAEPAKPKSCDLDPDITKHARPAMECARERFKAEEYDIADALASAVMERFPYSKLAAEAEELRVDVLFARQQYAEAEAGYDRFLKFHPTHERADEIRRKLADAHARVKP